jgi:hypothetical protein
LNFEKSFNKRLGIACFRTKRRWKKIERKTMALTLVLLIAFAAIIGTLTATSLATNANSTTLGTTTAEAAVTTLAAETESTTTDTSTATTADTESHTDALPFWGMEGIIMGDQGFSGGRGFGRGPRGCGPRGMGNIEVSSEYTETVNAILDSDTDVQNLIAEGYNVTSINPIIKSVIEADGTVATKATTAIVTLQNGTSGYAVASVDISQAKVTQIVIFTRTVIDKTTS